MDTDTQTDNMSSEKPLEPTPCPDASQQPRTSFLRQLKSFRRHFKRSKKHEYESHPSDSEETSVLSYMQIRANQLATYFDNRLKTFHNDFKQSHHILTCGSRVEFVGADGQGGYRFNCEFIDGAGWDIYYFEEPVSQRLSVILEEPMETEQKERMELNGLSSRPDTAEMPNLNSETNGTDMEETISTSAVFGETSNDCDNTRHYEPDVIEDLVEHYLNPDPKDPDEDRSASSVDSQEIAGIGVLYPTSMMPKSNSIPTESTPLITSTPPESPAFPIELLSGLKKICFEKFLIHRHLKEVTQLECIPEIPDWEFFDRETGGIAGVDGFVAEENRYGCEVKIMNSKTSSDTDKISINVDDKWVTLKGRKKKRFLDDLVRIQIAYSTITSPHLGPVELTYANNATDGMFPYFDLQDGTTSLTADVTPTVQFPNTYFLRLRHKAPPFLKHLVSTFPRPQTGPYPLQPPTPIWPHLRVNPRTGEIVRLSLCHEAKSVPWEIAACPPLQLSSAARERWIHSLRRHWWGAHIRDRTQKFESRPKLHRMVFGNELVGLECLLRLREDSSQEEIEVLEKKMVKVVGEGKSHQEMKRKWSFGYNPPNVI